MRFCSMLGILLLAGCSMFSSKSGGTSTLTLNNPYWEQVNVEVVLTRSSDCENRDGYISTAQILMRKNKTEAVDVPSGAMSAGGTTATRTTRSPAPGRAGPRRPSSPARAARRRSRRSRGPARG